MSTHGRHSRGLDCWHAPSGCFIMTLPDGPFELPNSHAFRPVDSGRSLLVGRRGAFVASRTSRRHSIFLRRGSARHYHRIWAVYGSWTRSDHFPGCNRHTNSVHALRLCVPCLTAHFSSAAHHRRRICADGSAPSERDCYGVRSSRICGYARVGVSS